MAQRRNTLVVAVLLVASLFLAASCGEKSTNPSGGGGVGTRELDSGNIPNGQQYVHTFANSGTYNYYCTIHGTGMAGSVVVVAGAPATAAVTIGPQNAYNPPTVSVAPGGTVTWTNTGSTHTVTSQ